MLALRQLERHSGTRPDQVSKTQLRDWLASGPRTGGSAFCLRTVRPYYRWLGAERMRADAPTVGIRINGPDEPLVTATKAQLDAMLRSAGDRSPRDHAMVAVLAATGCRRSELGLATFCDARSFLDQGLFRISRAKTMARVVPLDTVAEALRRYLRDHSHRPEGENMWRVNDPALLVGRVVKLQGAIDTARYPPARRLRPDAARHVTGTHRIVPGEPPIVAAQMFASSGGSVSGPGSAAAAVALVATRGSTPSV